MLKLIVNSVPHSGNHLVTSILDNLGFRHGTIDYTFYSGAPYFRRKQKAGINWRTAREIGNTFLRDGEQIVQVSVTNPSSVRASVLRNLLKKIGSHEYLIAHMPHCEKSEQILKEFDFRSISIIRDPRDMILSLIDHVRKRPQHLMHDFLIKGFDEQTRQIETLLKGDNQLSRNLVSVAKMYESMMMWSNSSDNLLLKFEDLVGPNGGGTEEQQRNALTQIIEHLGIEDNYSENDLDVLGAASFGKTSTFRKGSISRWKYEMTELENNMCKEYLLDILINLKYEAQ